MTEKYIHEMPLADCRPRFFRYAVRHEEDGGFDVPLHRAHGIKIMIPAPPCSKPVDYTLHFPSMPGEIPDTSRWPVTGTGAHDLTLEGSIGSSLLRPLHFRILDGWVLFLSDSNFEIPRTQDVAPPTP